MKVIFNDEECKVIFGRYPNNSIQIILKGNYTGNKIEATVFDESIPMKEGQILLKNYAENQGVEEALIEGGILTQKPDCIYNFAYSALKVFKLSGKALNHINFKDKIDGLKYIAI